MKKKLCWDHFWSRKSIKRALYIWFSFLLGLTFSLRKDLNYLCYIKQQNMSCFYALKSISIVLSIVVFFVVMRSKLIAIQKWYGGFNAIMLYFGLLFIVAMAIIYCFPHIKAVEHIDVALFTHKRLPECARWAILQYGFWSLLYLHVEIWGLFIFTMLHWIFAGIRSNTQENKEWSFKLLIRIGWFLGSAFKGCMQYVVANSFIILALFIILSIVIGVILYNFRVVSIKGNPSYPFKRFALPIIGEYYFTYICAYLFDYSWQFLCKWLFAHHINLKGF